MKRFWLMIAAAAVVYGAALAKDPEKNADEQAAVRAAIDSYVNAFNRGDAKGVAEHWSDKGEWVSPSGQITQGRDAIQKELTAVFALAKGLRIEVLDSSIRFVTADVAVEEGTLRVTRPAAPPKDSTYIAIQVKQEGKWKLDSVRETEIPEAPANDSPLGELDWLIGDWVDQGEGASIASSVTWTKNKTFLNYSFKVSVPGVDDLEGTQVIGWDPAAETIHSWMFDSDGGFGEGVWSKKDDLWVVKFNQTLTDGRKASATNIYTRVDDDSYTWQSIGRQVDGEFLPNIEPVKVVRKDAVEARKTKAVEKSQKQAATK
jgi:uncharacterized protein (TIGR02246 family)